MTPSVRTAQDRAGATGAQRQTEDALLDAQRKAEEALLTARARAEQATSERKKCGPVRQ